MIGWSKRDPLGRPIHPYEVVTLDQLSEHARLLIMKMARVAAQDFFEERATELREDARVQHEALTIEVGHRVKEALEQQLAHLANFPRQSESQEDTTP